VTDERRLQLVLWLNAAAVVASVGLVFGALAIQFGQHEVPCPLCLLQRLGFFAIAAGGLLNLRYGVRSAHYGVTLLGALTVGTVSLRQIALHICSGDEVGQCTGYGGAPLGWHLYTWAFVAAAAAILGVALLLMVDTPYVRPAKASLLTIVVFAYVGVAAVVNVGAVGVQCGVGSCGDPAYGSSMNDPSNVAAGLTPSFLVPTWRRGGETLHVAKGGAVTWSGDAGSGAGTAAFPDPTKEILSLTGGACGSDPGTYAVTITSSTAMTLKPIDEPCAARGTALTGSWVTG
jgi:disulfide bond formation protein DsbB